MRVHRYVPEVLGLSLTIVAIGGWCGMLPNAVHQIIVGASVKGHHLALWHLAVLGILLFLAPEIPVAILQQRAKLPTNYLSIVSSGRPVSAAPDRINRRLMRWQLAVLIQIVSLGVTVVLLGAIAHSAVLGRKGVDDYGQVMAMRQAAHELAMCAEATELAQKWRAHKMRAVTRAGYPDFYPFPMLGTITAVLEHPRTTILDDALTYPTPAQYFHDSTATTRCDSLDLAVAHVLMGRILFEAAQEDKFAPSVDSARMFFEAALAMADSGRSSPVVAAAYNGLGNCAGAQLAVLCRRYGFGKNALDLGLDKWRRARSYYTKAQDVHGASSCTGVYLANNELYLSLHVAACLQAAKGYLVDHGARLEGRESELLKELGELRGISLLAARAHALQLGAPESPTVTVTYAQSLALLANARGDDVGARALYADARAALCSSAAAPLREVVVAALADLGSCRRYFFATSMTDAFSDFINQLKSDFGVQS